MSNIDVVLPSINPKVFAQRFQVERKARNQTQADVANLLSVARTTVVAVEKGERDLSPAEILRLSKAWDISVSDLVRDRPIVESLVPQLRSAAPSQNLKDQEIEGLCRSAEKLRTLGENYLELERKMGQPLARNYPPIYTIGVMPISEAAADIAYRERQRLGLGDGPVPHLRAVLENDVFLRVFLLKMPSRIAGMFAYDEQLGGCIAVNVDHPPARRLWTLAHEFYHFLVDRFKADVYPLPGAAPRRTNENEKLADAFASHLLMPSSGLRRRFYDLKAAKPDGNVTPGDLLYLKRQYGVSFAALVMRLEELKLVREGTLEILQNAGFKVREAEELVGLPLLKDNEERLPVRMRILAVETYRREKISEGRLARFLNCERVEARRIIEEISSEHDISDNGVDETLSIPLQYSLGSVE